MSADIFDDASENEEKFRKAAIDRARISPPPRVCPCCKSRVRLEDGWSVCDHCGWEKDTRRYP